MVHIAECGACARFPFFRHVYQGDNITLSAKRMELTNDNDNAVRCRNVIVLLLIISIWEKKLWLNKIKTKDDPRRRAARGTRARRLGQGQNIWKTRLAWRVLRVGALSLLLFTFI